MPFPQADVFMSTFSHEHMHRERRRGLSRPRPFSFLSKSLNSAQFFFVAFLLFAAAGVQAYFKNTREPQHPNPSFLVEDAGALLVATANLRFAIDELLSPLMLLACTTSMLGTMCRGIELVIQAGVHGGK